MAKPAKKYSQAGRVHDTIRLIESRHGVTIQELAEETGVHPRTVHRDLAAIHEAGYPLVSEWRDGAKLYRFLTRFKDIPPISFTLQELMTLHFLRSQGELLQGTPFQEDLDGIFRKIGSVLPPRYAAHLERIAGVSPPLLQGRRDYRPMAEQLRTLCHALLHQYRVTIVYRSQGRGRSAAYPLDPYTLLFYKGGLYLLGYAHNRKALRTFAVERITRVTEGRERFEIPEEYRAELLLQDAFGIVREEAMAVRVRFSPPVAATVANRLWHPSQEVTVEPDGNVVVSFAAGGRLEIVAWVLSYGQYAEVLEPPELRAEVAAAARAMATRYEPVAVD